MKSYLRLNKNFPVDVLSVNMEEKGPPPQYEPVPAQFAQQVTIVTAPAFTAAPLSTVCPYCRQSVISSTREEIASKAHLYALILCLLGCWCGCCCAPYFMDSCKVTYHTCPNCHVQLGVYKHV